MKNYPIKAPKELISLINDFLEDPFLLEEALPGIIGGIEDLNTRTGCCDPEELFAGWTFCFNDDGFLEVSPIQPGYVKGRQKTFTWNGKKFE